jgi:hypothetical protein
MGISISWNTGQAPDRLDHPKYSLEHGPIIVHSINSLQHNRIQLSGGKYVTYFAFDTDRCCGHIRFCCALRIDLNKASWVHLLLISIYMRSNNLPLYSDETCELAIYTKIYLISRGISLETSSSARTKQV